MESRVVLVGAGHIARSHLEALARMRGVATVGICDLDAAKADKLARAFGVPHCAMTPAELIARCTAGGLAPNCAHVLVPPQGHAAVARELLEQGLHVLVEKPLALSTAEAQPLVALARARGLALWVNHNLTFHPLVRRLLADVHAGRIGPIAHVVSVTNLPIRQLEARDWSHFMFRAPGHIVLEQGVHPLSVVHALVGDAQRVTATAGRPLLLDDERPFYRAWQAAMECERGSTQVFLGPGGTFPESRLHVIGSDGAIQVDLLHGIYTVRGKSRFADFWDSFAAGAGDAARALAGAAGGAVRFVLGTLRLAAPADPFARGMAASIAAFHAEIAAGQTATRSAQAGVAVLDACERIIASAGVGAEATPAAAVAISTDIAARPGEVVVLGGTGFIGGHLVARLLRDGRPVTLVVRRAELPPWLRHPRLRVVRGSLEDEASIRAAVRGATWVIHLATGSGDTLQELRHSMVGGTEAVARACRDEKIRRLLYASTSAALYLGDAGATVRENDGADPRPDRRGIYAHAKILCERALLDLHAREKLPVVILRPCVVVGARGRFQHSGAGLWTRDNQCVGWGLGTTPVPFVLVEDVADAFARALEATGIDGQALNLAGDVRLTAREYVRELAAATGRPIRFWPRPLWVAWTLEMGKWLIKTVTRRPAAFPSWRDLASRRMAATIDCAAAKTRLGWQPVADRATFVARAIAVHAAEPTAAIDADGTPQRPRPERVGAP